jgi:two-component sensor histidine kinase
MLDSIKVMVDKTGKDKQKFNFHLQYYKVVYYTKGEKNKALFHLHQAKKYARGFKEMAMIYNKLGQYHHRGSSMLDSSMYYQIKAIENIKKHTDTYSLTHYYLDLGDLYITLGDLQKAKEFIDKSLDIARKGGKRIDYGYSLHNAIKVHKELKDSAKISALEAEYVAFKEGKSTQTAVAHQNTTFIADPVEKKKYLEESIEKHEYNNNLTMLLTNRLLLSDELRDEKNYAQAIKVLEDGLPSLNDSILLFRLNYYTKLKKLHEWNGNYKTALMYADSALVMESALLDEKRLEAIKEMEAKYHKLEQDNQILILQKQQDATHRNMYLALLGACFIAALALGIYLLYRQKSKTNAILEHKNKQITEMLQEKELLLREIHHRVKNNLQVVSSLLNLQSNYITDDIALEAINDGKNRVLSMALIHQNLYSDEHLAAIETKEYFDDLLVQLFESYNIDDEHIKLEKDIDNFLIDVDTMIPLGLITNELISNALKHAFKDRLEGKIFFSVKNINGNIIIAIKDNGIGVEPSLFTSSLSFGNKMIQAFVEKLKANFEVKNDCGTEIVMTIPINVSKEERA